MDRIKKFFKSEAVLVVSALAAVVSACFVPLSAKYLEYPDYRVLSLLFCLMAVVAGFKQAGAFGVLAQKLTAGAKKIRGLCLLLVMLCFFSSMLVTNDVALIAFVPFAVLVITAIGQTRHMIFVVTMQTVAANLGSMLTPVGNPQNLYLYSRYGISGMDFFKMTLPVTAASLILVAACCFLIGSGTVYVDFKEKERIQDKKKLVLYVVLFLLCLLTVFRIVHYAVTLVIVCLALLLADKGLFKKVDYGLLLTFVCFFVFVGNLSRLPAVQEAAAVWIEGRVFPVSILLSQIISNVPAAVLLSAFTDDYEALLLGANLGGLGTLVASLASLISFKLYIRTQGARPGRYLLVFSGVNVLFLLALFIFTEILWW